MYNGEKIRELLRHKGIKNKELMEYMGWTSNNQLKQVIEGNPRADILEKICDFLEIPTDTVFERNRYASDENSDRDILMKLIKEQRETINTLHQLLDCKDSEAPSL